MRVGNCTDYTMKLTVNPVEAEKEREREERLQMRKKGLQEERGRMRGDRRVAEKSNRREEDENRKKR